MSAFETFAFIYDQVMDEQLYEDWLAFTLRHLQKEKQLLELACGTGELAIQFAQKGYAVTALDLSEEMLTVANQRAEYEQADVQFVQADMLDLKDMGTYEVVTCYSDSICYLADELEVQTAFNQVYQVLKKDGVFLFDVHSLYQIDEVFPDYTYHYQTEDFAFLWESYPGELPHSIEHFLTFFIKNQTETFSREDELHLERTYPIEVYKNLLKQAGFKQIKVCADFKDSEPTNNSKRWFFVCYK
ncbi:MAG: class I SAM-dependent methyltransferase [Tetragenococcus halophilus]|nr:class I SAM-dependent methyltransferase [Tetragenococcus halophilus]